MKVLLLALSFLVLTAAPAAADTYVVGDSLTAQTYESGGWYVDAVPGAPLRSSHRRVASAVAQNPTALVVALGSNDVSRRSNRMESDISITMNRGVPCTILTTVKVNGVTPFYGLRWREFAQRWNRAVRNSGALVADWNQISKNSQGYFLADGLHLTTAGERAYDQMLRQVASTCL